MLGSYLQDVVRLSCSFPLFTCVLCYRLYSVGSFCLLASPLLSICASSMMCGVWKCELIVSGITHTLCNACGGLGWSWFLQSLCQHDLATQQRFLFKSSVLASIRYTLKQCVQCLISAPFAHFSHCFSPCCFPVAESEMDGRFVFDMNLPPVIQWQGLTKNYPSNTNTNKIPPMPAAH